MSAAIVSYATFLEIRTRRQRILAELLARANAQVVDASTQPALMIEAESREPWSTLTDTRPLRVLPVDL